MSDEFDVALTMPSTESGAEAAAVSHRHGASSAPAGDNPATAPSDSTTAIREQRVISESTRKAMAAIAKAGKESGAVDLGDELVPMEHEAAAVAKPAAAPVQATKPAEAAPAVDAPAASPGAAQAAQATAAEESKHVLAGKPPEMIQHVISPTQTIGSGGRMKLTAGMPPRKRASAASTRRA